MTIGRSTDPSTKDKRTDVDKSKGKASIRYNNPGAQYPSAQAAKFGQTGYGVLGDGHLIAAFPSPVNGAAANFDLLSRKYAGQGMTIGAVGKKWTGDNGFGVPGYDPNKILDSQTISDEPQAIAFLKAIAGREAGEPSALSDEEWKQAHQMFKAGSADAYLDGLAAAPGGPTVAPPVSSGPTGSAMLQLALTKVGQEYKNIQVPKDDPNWSGPWDCAEFASWLVYQVAKTLYGCVDDDAPPAQADAYTGAWKRDMEARGRQVTIEEAASKAGGILLRFPPKTGGMGHIVLCDGVGGTVEAMSTRYGVTRGKVEGRSWDAGILLPGFTYGQGSPVDVRPPAAIYKQGVPNMDPRVVAAIQRALMSQGYSVGPEGADGDYGDDTERAVVAFQEANGLVVDGEVGPETAGALGTSLVPGAAQVPDPGTFFPPVPVPQAPQQQTQVPKGGSGIDALELLSLLPRALRILELFRQIRDFSLSNLMNGVESGVGAMVQGDQPRQMVADLFPQPPPRQQTEKGIPTMSDVQPQPGPSSAGGDQEIIKRTIRDVMKVGGGILVGLGIIKSPDWASIVTNVEPWLGVASALIGWIWSHKANSTGNLLARVASSGILAKPIVVTKMAEVRDPKIAQLVASSAPVESQSTRPV